MPAQDFGPEAHDDGRMPGQRAGDRPGATRPRGVKVEAAHREELAGDLSKDERTPAPPPPGGSLADSRRYEFLDPPRATGELGWLAHYRVRKLLGEGGMGLVLEAEDTQLLRSVALKVIHPELSSSPQIARRFMLEARAMAALKNAHIVTIYQVGVHRGVRFLAMEYLRGMSLQCWLDRGHRLAVDLTLRLGREIADGLDAAHRRGLIHRDIKPANIWLEAPGGRVKILDFGLALTQGHDPQITSPGTTVGSPAYMAPEQARGERGDASSDLFSLGCVLYLLCTRELPFPGESIMAVLSSLANATPRAPREENPYIPQALDELIMRLLAKKAADRPPSAREVVESIEQIEKGLQAERQRAELPPATPVPAVEATAIYPSGGAVGGPGGAGASEKARRLRRSLGIAAAVVVLGVVAVAIRLHPRPRSTGATGPDRRVPGVATVPEPSRAAPSAGPPPVPPVAIAPPGPAEPAAAANPGGDETPRAVTPSLGLIRREDPPEPATRTTRRIERFLDLTRIINPDGDCRITLDKPDDRASVFVPGVAHLLSAEIDRMNAPRILREVAGDFEARAKVTGIGSPGSRASTSRYAPYHGAGILLWKDPGTYVRLEIAADHRKAGTYPYANFEVRQEGRLATTWGLKIEDGSSHLRLRRLGDELRAAFSPDGDHWSWFAPLIVKLPDRMEIGLMAVNSSAKPLEAHFEGLQLIIGPVANPGVEGDRVPSKPPAPPEPISPRPPAIEAPSPRNERSHDERTTRVPADSRRRSESPLHRTHRQEKEQVGNRNKSPRASRDG